MGFRSWRQPLGIGAYLVFVAFNSALAQDVTGLAGRASEPARQDVACVASIEGLSAPDPCLATGEERERSSARLQTANGETSLPKYLSFLRWMHADVMWLPTESDRSSVGIIGAHLAVANIGRVHIYGPPGIMLIREKSGSTWRLRPASTWGFSIYLTDLRFPGSQRRTQLFADITKVWTHGDYRTGMSMAGLSLAWKK